MAQSSWPFENIDTSETQYSQLFRNLGEGPVAGHGFELEPYADSTGMNVKVKSGQALVRGHYYDSTGTETITIPAADSTNPRIDRVVLRLDPTANSILLHLIQGTPNVSPSAPALTQTDGAIYDLPIAQVYVAANDTIIQSADVTDERTIFSPWTGSVTIPDVSGLSAALGGKQDVVSGVSSTEIGYLDGVTSAIQTQLNGKQNIVSGVSDTEIGYLDGVTSAIQTQIDSKAPSTSPTFTGTVVLPSTTSIGDVSSTEISYLDGVTSAIQTQLNGKAPLTQPIEAKTTAYTLTAADKGDLITCSGTFTITAPSATFAAGDRVDFINISNGTITFAGSGVTINAADSKFTVNKQWAGATLFFTSATTAVLIGALA